jgi:lipopolysaccharide export system protein LptC
MGRAAIVRKGEGARSAAAAPPMPAPAAAGWWPPIARDAYSRRVMLLKRGLPAVGLGLLLLVAAWPRLKPLLEDVRLALPTIDRRDARELRMVNPRYAGIDRLDRPYVLTAAAGLQLPERSDLMSLNRPRGQLLVRAGAKAVLTAATGVYQAEPQLLDLFGDVTLTHDNGTRFVTQAAHLDLARDTADGQDPVAGQGPSGDITAQGFRIFDKGDTILFTGRSHLLLKQLSAKRTAPAPPALPAAVEQAAARVAAAVPGPQAGANEPGATPKQHLRAKHHRQVSGATNSRLQRDGG